MASDTFRDFPPSLRGCVMLSTSSAASLVNLKEWVAPAFLRSFIPSPADMCG